MPDETINPAANLPDLPSLPRKPRPAPERDWFLLECIRLAELEVEQGITLSVGGCLITGTLISGVKFFEIMSTEIMNAKSKAIGDTQIYDNLKYNYDQFREMVGNTNDDPNDPVPIRDYIHLRDARVLFGGQSIPTSSGMLWRGRVQAVDGFFNGLISKG